MCASRRPDEINGFLMERGRSWRGLSRSLRAGGDRPDHDAQGLSNGV